MPRKKRRPTLAYPSLESALANVTKPRVAAPLALWLAGKPRELPTNGHCPWKDFMSNDIYTVSFCDSEDNWTNREYYEFEAANSAFTQVTYKPSTVYAELNESSTDDRDSWKTIETYHGESEKFCEEFAGGTN